MHAIRFVHEPEADSKKISSSPLGVLLTSIISLHDDRSQSTFDMPSVVRAINLLPGAADSYREHLRRTEFMLNKLAQIKTVDNFSIRERGKNHIVTTGNLTQIINEPWQIIFFKNLHSALHDDNTEALENIHRDLVQSETSIKAVLLSIRPLMRSLTPLIQGLTYTPELPPGTVVMGPPKVVPLKNQHHLAQGILAFRYDSVIENAVFELPKVTDTSSVPEYLVRGIKTVLERAVMNEAADHEEILPVIVSLGKLSQLFKHADQDALTRDDIECLKASPKTLSKIVEAYRKTQSATLATIDRASVSNIATVLNAIEHLANMLRPLAEQARSTTFIEK